MKRRSLIISAGVVLLYLVGGWVWFTSNATGMLGSLLFLPFVLAYGAGYATGNAAFWGVLGLCIIVLWSFTYTMVRSISKG